MKKEHTEKKTLRQHFQKLKRLPFLRGLMVVVALHWAMMNIVEFQYTKGIQQDVYSVQEETLVHDPSIALAEESIDYEREIARKMGLLHIAFNGTALCLQLVMASRILTSLGVVSSLMVHPLLAFLNVVVMTLRFGFVTAAVTRGGYELTGTIFKSAYDSSYYAIPHEDREDVKEFMQGIMKPIGAILGTLLILLFSLLFKGIFETLSMNIALMVFSLLMLGILIPLGKRYTELSEHNLSRKLDLSTRLNAIEILAQKGHMKNTPSLHKILNRSGEPEVLKVEIMRTLGERKELESVGVLLHFLKSQSPKLRLTAVTALRAFDELKKNKMDQAFTKHRILNDVKDALKTEKEDGIRQELMHLFYDLDSEQLIEFLFERIDKKDPKGKSGFIRMLRLFKDPNLKYYLEPYLTNSDAELRSASLIALWNFEELRSQLTHTLRQMLSSPKIDILELGIATAGEVHFVEEKEKIKSFLHHSNSKIHEAALLSLAQMEDVGAIEDLAHLLSNPFHTWFERTEEILKKLNAPFRRLAQKNIEDLIRKRIRQLLKGKKLHPFSKESVRELKSLYQKIGAHHQAHLLDQE